MAKPTDSTMTKLNDDCLMLIFEMMNLNERASLRATCKRFRWLCDLIKIRKLIIFEQKPPSLDCQLECTDEGYAWPDTAYVTQIDALFANRQLIANQMGKFLRTLVIYGFDRTRATLKYTFEALEHLELHDIDLKSTHLLQSSQIRHFANNCSYFKKPCEVRKVFESLEELKLPNLAKLSRSALIYGFDQLKSRNIVRLIMNAELESNFFSYCVEKQLFGSLEHLDVVLEDLGVLPYLSEQCPSLRRIDCLVEDLDAFLKIITKTKLKKLVSKLRDDLQVRLFGIPLRSAQFNKSLAFLIEFFVTFREVIRVNTARRLCLHLDAMGVDVLKKISEQFDLDGFFKLVSGLHLNDQTIAVTYAQFFAENFTNCREVKFESIQNPIPEPAVFENFLGSFAATTKEILMRANGFDVELGNATLDKLAVCDRVDSLYFEIWNRIDNLHFLFRLRELSTLHIFAYLPIEQTVVAELIGALKYLRLMQIVFVKPAGLSKEALKAFKSSVNAKHTERFRIRGLEFRVEIRTRNCGQIVRYLLIEERLCGSFCNNEDNKMFELIQFKRQASRANRGNQLISNDSELIRCSN